MVLLDLAARWAERHETTVFLGHVDHGLRGAVSRRDAAFVVRAGKERNIPCRVLRVPVARWARKHKKGVEEAARILRYQALERLARRLRCPAVATGHTLNDQVETVVMNLIRGAGPAGLAGMAEQGPWPFPGSGHPLRLLRPLLAFPRSSILSHLKNRKIPWREDATNRSPRFFRNRLRPTLAQWEKWRPGFMDRVAQTARLLRDEEDFWRRRIARESPFARRKSPRRRLDIGPFLKYSIVEQRRRLRLLYGLARLEAVERVRALAAAPPGAGRGPLDLPGVRVEKKGNRLLFRPTGTNPVGQR